MKKLSSPVSSVPLLLATLVQNTFERFLFWEEVFQVTWLKSLAPLSQILLIQVLHCPANHAAKIFLFITQHHHIQDFAKGDASLNQKQHFSMPKFAQYPAPGILE